MNDRSVDRRTTPHLDRWDSLILLSLFTLGAALFFNGRPALLHPLIDIGRDLYIPEQIAAGSRLYDDIAYYYPPLAPYLLSVFAAFTSWSLSVVAAIGGGIAAAVGTTIYLLSRRFIGRSAALCAAVLFVSLNFAGPYTYGSNFLYPYSHGAAFGILFFLAGLYFLVREVHIHRPGLNWWMAFGFLVAAGWCKLELAAFGTILMLFTAVLYVLLGTQSLRDVLKRLLASAVVAGLLLGLASIFFAGSGNRHWLLSQVLAPTLFEGAEAKRFYSTVTGSFMWELNLRAALQGAALVLLLIAVLAMLERLGTAERITSKWARTVILIALLAGALGIMVLLSGDRFLFYRAWSILQPALLTAAIIVAVREYRRSSTLKPQTVQLLILLVASIAVTSRIYLHISPRWYGFWMTLPLYLLIGHVLFLALPGAGIYGRKISLLWIPLFALISIQGLEDHLNMLSEKIHPIQTSRGVFLDHDPYRAAVFNGVLDYLETSDVNELVVMPEGLTINYFARIPNPLWYHTFSPMEIGEPDIEREVIHAMNERKPKWVLISNLAYVSWGGEGFGRGYAVALDDYIQSHYRLEKEWRSPTYRFFLLERVED